MKRKYLSALLMGVLTLSSVSTFTSCKDYDDDISNLQGQIDKLATADQLSQKVAELQALISSNKSDITSLQSELAKKTTLEEVKAVLADYATKEYVDAADKTLQDAIDALKTGDIAKLKEDVKAAQAAADKAAADAEKANADIVETLKTLATKTELEDAADAAQKAIEALESKNAEDLKKAQDAITETLKSYATKSDVEDGDKKTLESLASTIKNASDALALANTNKQAIADALDILGNGYSKENTVAAAIEAIQAQIGTPNKELGTLDSRLAAIEGVLNGVKDDETKLGLVAKVTNIENKLKDIIGEYTTMVTEVSLVGSAHYSDDLNKFGYNYQDANGVEHTINAIPLSFTSGKVGFNGANSIFDGEYVFGKDEKDNNDKSVTAADQQKFVKGTPFNDEQTLVVRINPTNAVLTSASIKLVDSQGNDLDDILEIGEPKQYTGLITRASQNTGLWSIPVNVKAGVAQSAIAKLKESKFIAYAVAVKNTETQKDAEDRYVRSTYDVIVPKAKDFEAVNDIDEVQIWSESTMTEKNAITLGTAKKKTSDPSTSGRVVKAKNNETINIKFPADLYGGKVKYFYVVRDDHNTDTQGSDQSELNAWKGYKYDGTAYGKVIAADPMHPGTLKINIGGSSVADDEIGFRVFAINYNGKLASRNGGQSFVVYVGDEQNKATVEGNVAALYEKTVIVATNPSNSKLNETGWLKLSSALKDRSDATDDATALKSSYGVKVGNQTVTFDVEFSENGEKKADATVPYSKLKYVKFICTSKMAEWKDDLKAVGSIKTTNKKGLVENEIKFSLTKVLPTKESTIAWMGYKWKTAQKDENGNYTAYVYPNTDVWTSQTSVVSGYKAMTQAITGLKDGTVFHVEGVQWDEPSKKYIDADFTDDPWKVTVPVALIDAKTPHKTTIGFNYGNISSAKNGEPYIIYVEEVQTIFACPLAMSAQSYELTKKPIMDENEKVTGYKDVNYLTYGSAKTVDEVNILDYIIGSNKFANEFEGSLSHLAATKYADIKAKLISKESGKADYFTVSFEDVAATTSVPAHKKMVFHPAVHASSPLRDVESELVITLTDAFGHNDMVYKFPFTVKKR